uniref:Tetratricopeptide TPR_2 repeat protein n=1 Tax=Solibacter usitatus (strain Ellin6076) TaxID=234267 RepID=Q029R6_SOLUE
MRAVPLPVLLVLLAAGCARNSGYYAEQGNRSFAQARYQDAELDYRKAIQKDPQNGEATYRLALTELKLDHGVEAYGLLVRAVDLLPDNDSAKVKLGDLALGALMKDTRRSPQFYEQVEKRAGQLLARDPQSVDGLRFNGFLALLNKRPADAIAAFEQVLARDPANRDVALGLFQSLTEAGQSAAAEKAALEFVQKDRNFGDFYDILYQFYLTEHRPADAEKILQLKVSNNPGEAAYVVQLARHYRGANRTDEMAASLQRLLKDSNAFPLGRMYVGDFYAGIQDWNAALEQYNEGMRASPAQKISYGKRIADLWLAQGQGERAAEAVAEVLKTEPNDMAARAVKASLLMARGGKENLAAAASEFRDLMRKDPGNATWHFNLGRALAAVGDSGAAGEFQEAVRLRADFIPPRIALAELSRINGNYQQVLRYADEVLAIAPGLSSVHLLRSMALMGLDRSGEAQSELRLLERLIPGDAEVQFQLATTKVKQGKYREAEGLLRSLNSKAPGDARILRELAGALTAQNQQPAALAMLQEELNRHPEADSVRELLGETSLESGHYDVAIEQAGRLLSKYPDSARLHLLVGKAYFRKGDLAGATRAYQRASVLRPSDPAAVNALASTYAVQGQASQAMEAYRHVLKLNPDDWGAMNNLAFLIAENNGSLDEALSLSSRVIRKFPNVPDFNDTLGWIYVKKGMSDSAIPMFRKLARQDPQNATYRYHLGKALVQKGDPKSAAEQFQHALLLNPSPELRQDLTSALQETR